MSENEEVRTDWMQVVDRCWPYRSAGDPDELMMKTVSDIRLELKEFLPAQSGDLILQYLRSKGYRSTSVDGVTFWELY